MDTNSLRPETYTKLKKQFLYERNDGSQQRLSRRNQERRETFLQQPISEGGPAVGEWYNLSDEECMKKLRQLIQFQTK